MKKTSIKQGTREWENLKETRIGSSEVFDIVRYYATDVELQNCGIDAKLFREETPFVTTWALYHKMIRDGVYQKPLLEPYLSEYGLAMETYGLKVLQEGREFKLRKGQVFVSDNLIASLDISGISEDIDQDRHYDFGDGRPPVAQPFVCEQKTISPFKDHLPLKYVIQAQYQITMAKAKFFILQAIILKEDTPFERGKIVSLANTNKKKFFEYVKDKVSVVHIYFKHNEALSRLILRCLHEFFSNVRYRKEPRPFVTTDKVSNILTSIRNNSFYNENLTKEFDLSGFVKAKSESDEAEVKKQNEVQKIIDFAMSNNCSKFVSPDGYTAKFSSNGRLLITPPKEEHDDKA